MTTTTSYGTWCNRVAPFNSDVASSVADAVSGGDADWHDRMEAAGAFDAIEIEYRCAIDAALPPEISLCGEEFIGPAYDEDCGDWSDYPHTEIGDLDYAAIVEGIDLMAIVERHDVDNV